MESLGDVDDYIPAFYVGQHESHRESPVTDALVRRAHECNVRAETLWWALR